MKSPLGIPERIGRYELLSELGRGSMGHVYLALDPNIERKVALKVFLPLLKVSTREEWELRQRFILEARAAGKVRHPGIVVVFDADTDPDTNLSFIAMEWVDGPSLQEVVRESGPLPPRTALAITEQVAIALDSAHQAKLVHRDIKPANILLDEEGRPKVTDFGIAKLASMSITAASWIPGSPFYMSPEQVRNEHLDGRSDLYSLGVVLYQCVTGTVPFESDSLAGITYMILEMDPRPPQMINPEISDRVAQLIQRALSKSPADRFQSGSEFAEALRWIAAEEVGEGDPQTGKSFPSLPARQALGSRLPTRSPTGTEPLPSHAVGASPALHGVEKASDTARPALNATLRPNLGRRSGIAAAAFSLLALLFALAALRAWVARTDELGPSRAAMGPEIPNRSSDDPLPLAPDLVAALAAPEPEESLDASRLQARTNAEVVPTDARAVPIRETASGESRSSGAAETTVETGERGKEAPRTEVLPLPATLEVVFRNRLKSASISVYVDESKVWTESVTGAKSFFKRAIGKDVWSSLRVAEGRHTIDVRITGTEGKVDLVKRTTAEFSRGETKRLRIVLLPPKTLKASWKEVGHG
jgi:serine/threonine-protein kinase